MSKDYGRVVTAVYVSLFYFLYIVVVIETEFCSSCGWAADQAWWICWICRPGKIADICFAYNAQQM